MYTSLSKLLLVTACVCFSLATFAQKEGQVIEENKINSSILNKEVQYAIYLPPDYTTSVRAYPVVYLLHGYSDDHTAWVQFGEIKRYADKAIADGTIPPMIIIMPNAFYSWYCNSFDGKVNYEDFFIQELIPFIDKTYRVKNQKRYRGLAGLSMGGYGALLYAIKYPDMFAAAAPLSAGVFTNDEVINMNDKSWETYYAPVYGPNLKGKNRLNKEWQNNSILQLIAQKPKTELKKVRYWIDCGDDDFLIKGNCYLHLALTEREVPHQFRIRDGSHSWSYWRDGITDALRFIGESFH